MFCSFSKSKEHKFGWTALILAAAWNNNDIVKILLENGADPDGQEKYVKPNPTQLSRRIGDAVYTEADELKMKTKRDLFPEHIEGDLRGATALFYAVLNNNVKMVETLLEHGADPLLKTRSGYHPLEICDENTNEGLHIKRED